MEKPTSHWEKRIVLPIWTIRSCLLLVILIGFSAAIGLHDGNAGYHIKYSAAAAFLTCIVLVLLLDVAQVILWARNKLHALIFVGLTAAQAIFWGLVLILDIVGITVNDQSSRGMGMIVVMFLLYLSLFVYAVRGYMRQRKNDVRGYYSPALNPKTSDDLEPCPGVVHDLHSTEHRTLSDDGNDHGRLGGSPSKHSEANQPYSDSPEKF